MESLPNLDLKNLATRSGPEQHLAFDELARRIRVNPSSWSPKVGPWPWGPLDITRAPNAIEAEWTFLKWSQRFNDETNSKLEQEQETRLDQLEFLLDQYPDSLATKYLKAIGNELTRQECQSSACDRVRSPSHFPTRRGLAALYGLLPAFFDELRHHLSGRSSSACATTADTFRRISFPRFSSRTGHPSSFIRCFSSVVSPPRCTASRSACRTHFRNVSARQPIFDAID